MIYKNTYLRILDNSGVQSFKVIHVSKTHAGRAGMSVIGSVKGILPAQKIKKGEIFQAVIVQLAGTTRRFCGFFTKFGVNAGVLLKKNDTAPLANRLNGFILEEVRLKGHHKLVALALGTV